MSQDVYFLLMPGFSALGFISALEPLRVANRFRGELYRWHILSADGGAVLASNGMSVNADAALEPLKKGATLLVVAGFEPLQFATPALEHWLRRLDHEGVTLGAIDTGACVLAEAGLLDGHRLTLHWEAIDAFKEAYPHLSVTQELFEIDRRRITCAGGTASIDLMLDLIAQAHGPELAIQVSEQFVLSRIRPRKDHQRMQIAALRHQQQEAGTRYRRNGTAYRTAPEHLGPGRNDQSHPTPTGAAVSPAPQRHPQ
jgi:AraC family carnitine catabolism transcriptional activator